MPIEPTNVSKSAVREVEKASASFGSWSSMQGSSTGGKDRPNSNSIWEKAITGAQKLFGSRTPKPQTAEESSETEDSAEPQSKLGTTQPSFDTVPGFGSRGFGRFSGAAFGGNAFGTIETSRTSTEAAFDSSRGLELDSSKAELAPKLKLQEESIQRTAEATPKERPMARDEESDEEGTREERPVVATTARKTGRGAVSQAPLASPQAVQAPVPPSVQTDAQHGQSIAAPSEQAVVGQPVSSEHTQASSPVGQGSTAAAQQVTGTQTNGQPPATPSQNGAPATQEAATQLSSSQRVPAQSTTAETADPKPGVLPQSRGQATPESAKQAQETVKTATPESAIPAAEASVGKAAPEGSGSIKAQGTPQNAKGDAVPPSLAADATVAEKAKSGDSLGFDLAKAKEVISDTLGSSARQVAAKPATPATPATPAAQQPAQAPAVTEAASQVAKPLSSDSAGIRLGETSEGMSSDASKRELSTSAQQRPGIGRGSSESAIHNRASTGTEAVAAEVKANQASGQASTANVAREAAAAASRIQNPVASNKPVSASGNGASPNALGGVAGGQGVANASVNTQGAQQGNSQNQDGGDPAAKQDFNAAMKQASNAKGTEKAGGESAQAFEAKVEAAANRRAEAASKASQTSYVSKTAAEVKETIATLTKSIDRLVTDKANAMNLKINFEGGGSVNLRISMDGSAVSTQMQTDVVGLEAAIKANWAELANDWNQKGVKLNTPQFQNSESSKDNSFENLNEFASKGDRQAAGRNGEGRGQTGTRGMGNRGFDSSSEEGANQNPSEAAAEEVVSESKIKTYA